MFLVYACIGKHDGKHPATSYISTRWEYTPPCRNCRFQTALWFATPTTSIKLHYVGPIRSMNNVAIFLRRQEPDTGLVVQNWSNGNAMPTVVACSWSARDLHRGSEPSRLVRWLAGTPRKAGDGVGHRATQQSTWWRTTNNTQPWMARPLDDRDFRTGVTVAVTMFGVYGNQEMLRWCRRNVPGRDYLRRQQLQSELWWDFRARVPIWCGASTYKTPGSTYKTPGASRGGIEMPTRWLMTQPSWLQYPPVRWLVLPPHRGLKTPGHLTIDRVSGFAVLHRPFTCTRRRGI